MARPFQKLTDLSEGQWGLVTRRQADQLGVPPASFERLVQTGLLERVAHGVYRVRGAGEADHLALRAAWLQLDPGKAAWERLDDPNVAVVSHASAASLHQVGDLRPDIHEFTFPRRRQTRRPDVRIHRGVVPEQDRVVLRGLPVTRAARMLADLLADHVEPTAVARITVEVIEGVLDYPRVVADRIAQFAAGFGLTPGDGVGLLDRLLELGGGQRDRAVILAEARR
jgi:predicted transcriptional regulator of viral defense system